MPNQFPRSYSAKTITYGDAIRYNSYGIKPDGALFIHNNAPDKWVHDMAAKDVENNRYIRDILANSHELKVSDCIYISNGNSNCQGWGGNSGGPWFDSENKLAGITRQGYFTFDGNYHARLHSIATVENIRDNSVLFNSKARNLAANNDNQN
jgi:hypothetical protein